MALTQDRKTPTRVGDEFSRQVAASTKIFAGSLVALNASGFAVPGSTATGLKADGRAEEYVDNSGGADGDVLLRVRKGVFRFENDGTVDITDIDATAWIVDDETVANNSATDSRSEAGKIVDVDGDGVWVDMT